MNKKKIGRKNYKKSDIIFYNLEYLFDNSKIISYIDIAIINYIL